MIEAPQRIKKSWQRASLISAGLGILALVPFAINRETVLPWVAISIALWLASAIIYWIGRHLTGGPLRPPRMR